MSSTSSEVVGVRSRSSEETERVGATLAEVLAAGTVVGLAGPLGAGKTCFVRGMAEALGIDPTLVASPTFVYLVDYRGKALTLHHADLYRLLELPAAAAPEVYESIGLFAAFGAGGIAVVEWWDGYRGALPPSLVLVEFVMENAEHRRIAARFETPDSEARATAFAKRLGDAGLAPER